MRVKHWSSGEIKEMSAAEIIDYEVTSVNSERGQLEDIEAKISKLTEFVGRILNTLTPAQQRDIVKDSFYWRPDDTLRLCEFSGDDEHDHDEAGYKKRCKHVGFSHCTLHKLPLTFTEDGWRVCVAPCTTPVQVK